MKTASRLIILALAFVSMAANAGFFVPRDKPEPDMSALAGVAKATFACSLQIRYNTATPGAQELTYIGGAGCTGAYLRAIQRAAESIPAMKVSAPGERANDPVYQCSTSVNFDPATASDQVELVHAGVGCESSRRAAVFTAVPAVRCQYQWVPCTP